MPRSGRSKTDIAAIGSDARFARGGEFVIGVETAPTGRASIAVPGGDLQTCDVALPGSK